MTGLKKVTWPTQQHPHFICRYNTSGYTDANILSTFVLGRTPILWVTAPLCVQAHVPLLAAVPEAPVPAELYVSGYPGSLPASHTSERTANGSPSSKRRSQAPSTNTQKHVGIYKYIKKTLLRLKVEFWRCEVTNPFELNSKGLVPGLVSYSLPDRLPHHGVVQLQNSTHLNCRNHNKF